MLWCCQSEPWHFSVKLSVREKGKNPHNEVDLVWGFAECGDRVSKGKEGEGRKGLMDLETMEWEVGKRYGRGPGVTERTTELRRLEVISFLTPV